MIIQSSLHKIDLLPAIPEEWTEGSIKGLKVRGNIELSIRWEKGELKSLELISKRAQETTLIYKGKEKKVSLEPRKPLLIRNF